MAMKNLGSGTTGTIYTVPASMETVLTIGVTNPAVTTNIVKIIVSGAVIEEQVYLDAGGVLERSGIAMAATENIEVSSDNGDAIFTCYGIEQGV